MEEGNDQATVSSLLLVSSLCLEVSPCLSPPFPWNLFSGPRQSLRALLSSDPSPVHQVTPTTCRPQQLPAQRAPGLASRLPSPLAVFTLPLLLALPSGWLCSRTKDDQSRDLPQLLLLGAYPVAGAILHVLGLTWHLSSVLLLRDWALLPTPTCSGPQGPTLGALELGCMAMFTRIFWTVCSGHQATCHGVGSWNKGVLSSISWYVVLLAQMV